MSAAQIRSNPPVNMSLQEAAYYVGVSAYKLRTETIAGGIRPARIGRRLIFKRTELDRWLDVLAAAA